MNRYDRRQAPAILLILVIQIRLVLEEVRVQFAFSQLYVRLNIIGKFLDFQLDALSFKLRRNCLQNLGMRNRRSADNERNRLGSARSGRSSGGRCRRSGGTGRGIVALVVATASGEHNNKRQAEQGQQYFFHDKSPSKVCVYGGILRFPQTTAPPLWRESFPCGPDITASIRYMV
ncbi:hypothetical protein D3C71_1462090 [compost metagenome]